MPSPLRWLTHPSFAQGIVQDVPRHLLPDDAVWDADNVFIKRAGSLAKRGGTTAVLTSGTTAQPVRTAVMLSQSADAVTRGYALGNGGSITAFTPGAGTSAGALMTSNCTTPGRPFLHQNLVVVPDTNSVTSPVMLLGGGNTATPYGAASANSYVITAGDPVITNLTVGDVALVKPGWFLLAYEHDTILSGGVAPPDTDKFRNFTGVYRVISATGTTCTVEPTPQISFSSGTSASKLQGHFERAASNFGPYYAAGATCGTSWQNRVVLGNVQIYEAGTASRKANRLIWSILPTETLAIPDLFVPGDPVIPTTNHLTTYAFDGYAFALSQGYPSLNYVDIQQIGSIVAVEPIGQGSLLILGDRGVGILIGTLQTITADVGALNTYRIDALSTSVNCISDQSVQTTPYGVCFASRDGIYLTDGHSLRNLTKDRIKRLWRDTYSTATIYGSAVLGSTYIVSTSAGSLLCDLATGAWVRASTLKIAGGCLDPNDSVRVYSSKGASSASSSTDKIMRVDTIFDPASTNTNDANGVAVVATVETKAYTEGDPLQMKRFRHLMTTIDISGSAAGMTVTAKSGVKADESSTFLGTVGSSALTQATRFDASILSNACALSFVTSGTVSTAEILEIRTATNQLRAGRTS